MWLPLFSPRPLVVDNIHVLKVLQFLKHLHLNLLTKTKELLAKAILSLEERGLIKRIQNPDNRRKNILNITDAGKQTITDVVGVYDEWLGNIEYCLSNEEKEQFHDYCVRLLEKAKEFVKNEEK